MPRGDYVFRLIKFVLAIFVGHPVTISAIMFGILMSDFRQKDFQKFLTRITHGPGVICFSLI